MRKRWIQINGELVPADEYTATSMAPVVRGDIGAYKSMVTGEMIEGRKAHREHLKRHGVVEVGNDFDNAKQKVSSDDGLKRRIAEIAYQKLRY